MKDYRQIVKESQYGDLSGLSEEERNDYRSSFLMGMNILLSGLEDETLHIHPADYPDTSSIPPFLRDGDKVPESSVKVCSFPLPGEENKPSWEQMVTYKIFLTSPEGGIPATRIYEESELSVEEVFSIFAFIYSVLDNGEYEDIDEFYGYELS
jgi:hypothetical protein